MLEPFTGGWGQRWSENPKFSHVTGQTQDNFVQCDASVTLQTESEL